MGFNEIANMWKMITMFKYALKKKYKNVIFFDDDFYPSYLFKEWINQKIYFKGNKIIQFQCSPPGFLEKKSIRVLNNKNNIKYVMNQKSKVHLLKNRYAKNYQTISEIQKKKLLEMLRNNYSRDTLLHGLKIKIFNNLKRINFI